MAKAAKKTMQSLADGAWKTDKTHVALKTLTGQKFRGGRRVTTSGVVVAKADLSDEHVAAILSDTDVVHEEVDAPEAE